MFHVGQKVVCVDARPWPGTIWLSVEALTKGQTYTIARIFLDYTGLEVVWLCEVERVQGHHPGEIGYGIYRFRPVKTTSIEIFSKMLAPLPTKELA